eukprot:GHVH01002170.1.p1 GENE.GHVH01002170.1~~GHVH01002170.1.p1  ORF type:complete len:355 (-),score=53.62 GHVH01002170.1:832-1896(-)
MRNSILLFISLLQLLTESVSGSDVYDSILDKPYSMSHCEGRPHGCTKIIKRLQMYEKENRELKAKISQLEATSSGKESSKSNKPVEAKTGKPLELTDNTFSSFVKESEYPSLVLFYAPWCGHCKAMMGDYNKLAGYMKDKTVNIIMVDATEEKTLASKFKIQGFPSLIYFPKGKKPQTYRLSRDFDGMRDFLEQDGVTKQQTDTLKIEQLRSNQQFLDNCEEDICVITVLPHLIDGGQASGRNKSLKSIYEAMNKDPSILKNATHFWMEGGNNLQWEEAVIGGIGYPATAAVDFAKREVGVYRKNSVETKGLYEFYKLYSTGRVPMTAFRAELPKLKSVPLWDGEDYHLADEEL